MPKITIHMDGSGDWGHAYFSITSSSGVTEFAGLWPANASDTPYIEYGKATVRGNDPVPNPYYDPTLPKTGSDPADPDLGRDINSYEYYPSDKQRYEKIHYSELPRYQNTPRYDQDYTITEQQYQNAKTYINNVKSNPEYSGLMGNCTDFVQGGWQSVGFSGGFAGDVPLDMLAQLGYAGVWASMFHQDGEDVLAAVGTVVAATASIGLMGWGIGGAMAVGMIKAYAEYRTPIALDLNGSGGINTYSSTSSLNKAFFDMDNDMFREKVQWLNPVDGWLAMDRNEDGLITNQRELFGDSDGKLAYQKLAELNTNNTGSSANAITSADTAWGNLRVWIDADIDGISDAGELKTLNELNITSISLETTPKKGTFAINDNIPLLFPYFLVA